MFDFFEVPPSNLGAIGPVANGENTDWQRQDRRPGQINLNLIIDEEVFLGLFDDPRMNLFEVLPTATPNDYQDLALPQIVTQIDTLGNPTFNAAAADLLDPTVVKFPNGRGFYAMPNRGVYNFSTGNSIMKAAFSDFLKLRHGGSGWLFAYGSGLTGPGAVPCSLAAWAAAAPDDHAQLHRRRPPSRPFRTSPIATERPFRSHLLYPGHQLHDDAAGRPAAAGADRVQSAPRSRPPRSTFCSTSPARTPMGFPNSTTGGFPLTYPVTGTTIDPSDPLAMNMLTTPNIIMDPGLKNPYISDPSVWPQHPPIPVRRLFQIPDHVQDEARERKSTR